MSLKVYMAIAIPITVGFIYALFTHNTAEAITNFVAGIVLSSWYSGAQHGN